jgi:hypothetical protein
VRADDEMMIRDVDLPLHAAVDDEVFPRRHFTRDRKPGRDAGPLSA